VIQNAFALPAGGRRLLKLFNVIETLSVLLAV
jgi:hypothetical protein